MNEYWLARDRVVATAERLFDAAHAQSKDGELAAAWATETEYQALLDAVEDMRAAQKVTT